MVLGVGLGREGGACPEEDRRRRLSTSAALKFCVCDILETGVSALQKKKRERAHETISR